LVLVELSVLLYELRLKDLSLGRVSRRLGFFLDKSWGVLVLEKGVQIP